MRPLLRFETFFLTWAFLVLCVSVHGNEDFLTVTGSITHETCLNSNNGAIDITVTSGSGNYSYSWSNGAVTEDLSGLAPGNYSVTVTDINTSDTATESFTVDPGFDLLSGANGNPKAVTCVYGADGTLQLVITAGKGPYTYDWRDKDGNQVGTNSLLKDVTAGTYTVTVTGFSNANVSCTATATYEVTEPDPIFTINSNLTHVSCNGGNNGAIDLTVTSPKNGKISYNWTSLGQSSEDVSFLTAGQYEVVISQGSHCEVHTYTITEPDALALTTTPTNVLCSGESTGQIDLTVTGGTSPYTYAWSNGASTEDLTALTAGSYTVTVTDAQGCTAQTTQAITEVNPIVITQTTTNVTCKNGNDGSIDITVTGGAGGYTYSWSNGASVEDISGLLAGSYTIIVTDGSGCKANSTINITEPTLGLTATTSITNVSCFGGSTGAIDLTVSNANNPVSFAWSNGANTEDLANINAGTYSVTITDASGCLYVDNIVVNQPAELNLSHTKVDNNCFGESSGSIDLTVSGGTAPFSYAWSNGSNTEDISSLPAGNYSVTVTDANSCNSVLNVSISEPSNIMVLTAKNDASCNASTDGSIDLSVSGGTAPYTYVWNTGAVSEDLNNITAGNYSVTITDAKGCQRVVNTTITEPSAITITEAVTDAGCASGANGAIDITVVGGTGPYTYSWSNGSTSEDLTNLAFGSYTITVTDSKGCSNAKVISVSEDSSINISETILNAECNGQSTGSITLNVTGGTPAYTYVWADDPGNNTPNRTNLSVGTYQVTVNDLAGCSAIKTFNVTEPATLTLNTTQVNVACNSNNNGSIDLFVAGGTAPYSYNWNSGTYNTQDLNNIGAGSYSVIVTDKNGCTATTSVTITEPNALTISNNTTNVLCNGQSTGSISLSVTGGTAPYTYNWSNGATTENITNLSAGTYTVTVTDANSCVQNQNVLITEPAAIGITSSVTDVTCKGDTNGQIDITISGGTSPYNVLWSNGATTEDLSNLSPGNYSVQITDASGCVFKSSSIAVGEPSTSLTATTSITNSTCNGANNGIIDLTVSGGVAPITFNWSNGETTEDVSNLAPGNYQVQISDANGCIRVKDLIVSEPAPIAVNLTATDPTCNGQNNGQINASITGGTAPYTFSWASGQATQNISGLAAGNYSLTVTDANGCSASANTTLTDPAIISLGTNTTNVSCNGGDDGVIDLSIAGGTAPFSYAWSNGSSTQDLNNLVAGTYQVTVTDNSGCTANLNVTVTEPTAEITATTSITNINCKGQSNGAIDLTPSGGTPPYSYQWDFGATTEDVSSLPAGSYSVTISDQKSCIKITGITISEPAQDLSIAHTLSNSTCFGNNDGSINTTVSGGTAPYTYSWSNGATTSSLNNLAPGNYSLTVTDNQGCTTTANYTISEPAELILTSNPTHVSCNNGNNGAIDLSISGGTGPYNISWSNGQVIEDLTGLTAGSYTVTIVDDNGCSATLTQSINQPSAIVISEVITEAGCNGGTNGQIDLTVTGGTGPYTYNWSNGALTEDLTNLSAGNYTVTVTDSNSCSESKVISVSELDAIVLSTAISNVNCNSGNDGSIDLTVSGGTSPYSYLWSTGAITEDINNLTEGTYSVEVTDALACTSYLSIEVTQPDPLNVNVSKADISCNGANDGKVILELIGESSPYGITVLGTPGVDLRAIVTDSKACSSATFAVRGLVATAINSAGWSLQGNTLTITNLPAGNFEIFRPDQGNTVISTQVIAEPSALSISANTQNISCAGGSNGSIEINPTGGTGSYTYRWSNGATTRKIQNLASGTYTVEVKDVNGCVTNANYTLTEPSALNISAGIQNVNCYGSNTGNIIPVVSGGTGPYTYSWSNGSSSSSQFNLTAGSYSLLVTDANGCTSQETYNVTQPDQLVASEVITNLNCFENGNGAIALNVNGGTGSYTYQWSNGATSKDISGLAAGNYSVLITDTKGCVINNTYTISQPSALVSSGTKMDINCFGNSNGSIDLTVTGGTAPYTYLWSTGATTKDLNNLTQGNYTVQITDSNGCTINNNFTIDQPTEMTINVQQQNILCADLETGSITLNITEGTGPYTVNWTNGLNGNSIANLSAGSYQATVTDSNGCNSNVNVTITQPEVLAVTDNVQNLLCFEDNSGVISLTPSGGSGNYTYQWSNGESTKDITGLAAGNYSVQITDGNGCVISNSYTLTQPTLLVSSGTKTDNTCYGNSDGSIDLSVLGGTAPYTFAWSNGASSEDLNGLQAGNYSVQITDSKGCTSNSTFTIVQPAEVLIDIQQQDILCADQSTGSIVLNISGGSGPYNVIWTNGASGNSLTNLAAGTYEGSITDSQGCTSTVNVTLTQPEPLSIIENIDNVSCFGNNDGRIAFTVNGGVAPYTYSWSSGENGNSRSSLSSGSYSVTITDANNCSITETFDITQPEVLTVTVTQNLIIDCDTRSITEEVTITTTGGTGTAQFNWNSSNFISENRRSFDRNGLQTIEVRDDNNCIANVTVNVVLPELGESSFEITDGTTDPFGSYTLNTPITFSALLSDNITSFTWDFGDGKIVENEALIDHTYTEVGDYLVTLTALDNNGCTTVSELDINVNLGYEIVMPTAFTPNGDNLNDRFYPEYYGLESIKLVIYNNWGDVVFVSEDIESGGWNGLVRNQEAPAGGYAFKLFAQSISGKQIEETGSFVLVQK